jgi:ribosomal 50S subunit-recycling heat shock protein
MRLDQFLKLSRLVIRRSVAAEMCRAGAVQVNDTIAKPGREIKENDVITLRRRGEQIRARVVAIPVGNVPKNQAASFYDILSVERYNELDELLNKGQGLEGGDQELD